MHYEPTKSHVSMMEHTNSTVTRVDKISLKYMRVFFLCVYTDRRMFFILNEEGKKKHGILFPDRSQATLERLSSDVGIYVHILCLAGESYLDRI